MLPDGFQSFADGHLNDRDGIQPASLVIIELVWVGQYLGNVRLNDLFIGRGGPHLAEDNLLVMRASTLVD